MDPEPDFDPYQEWLDIDPALVPPNFYDLLGLNRFESDAQKIQDAFEDRLASVRTRQTGPRGKYTQDLLNEIARARICLLNEKTKSEYDDSLRSGIPKPPIAIEQFVADAIPPIQEHSLQISLQTEDSGDTSPKELGSTDSKAKKLSVIYVSGCIGLLIVIWAGLKFFGKNGQTQPETQTRSEKTGTKQSPTITNIKEENKGLLPGTNNSFSLGPSNATLDGDNPVVIQTAQGDFLDQWTSDQDSVQWEIWIKQRGYYEAIVKYNATGNDSLSRLVLKQGKLFPKKIKMRTAEEQDVVFEEEFVLLFREPGSHVLEFSTEGDAGDFRLHSIMLRPNRIQ